MISALGIANMAITLTEHKSLWSVISMYNDFKLWNPEHQADVSLGLGSMIL